MCRPTISHKYRFAHLTFIDSSRCRSSRENSRRHANVMFRPIANPRLSNYEIEKLVGRENIPRATDNWEQHFRCSLHRAACKFCLSHLSFYSSHVTFNAELAVELRQAWIPRLRWQRIVHSVESRKGKCAELWKRRKFSRGRANYHAEMWIQPGLFIHSSTHFLEAFVRPLADVPAIRYRLNYGIWY